MKKSFADIYREALDDNLRRMRVKVPEWDSIEGMSYPARINVEQCSSSPTARYKADLATRLAGAEGFRIADLTGGLGVDCWAFSAKASKVLYNEMNSELCDTVRSNHRLLGLDNIIYRNMEAVPGNIRTILDGFAPDILFLDPARRSESGRKVFLLEECSPDILAMQDELCDIGRFVMVKISPMADISMVLDRLRHVSEIHVLGFGGECKELLLVIDRRHEGEPHMIVAECGCGKTLDCGTSAGGAVQPVLLEGAGSFDGRWLFEPGCALMKSGCHGPVCNAAGMRKVGRSTHIYLSDQPDEKLSNFGKFRRIKEVRALDSRGMKELGKLYPHSGVTARNIPMSSDELRIRMKVDSGLNAHIYGLGADYSDGGKQKLLVVTEA